MESRTIIKPYLDELKGLTPLLEEHENKRQKVMEFMRMAPCICYIKSAETGKYEFVNKSLCDVLGRMEDDILGKTDADIFPVEVAKRYVGYDLQVLKFRRQIVVISAFKDKLYLLVKFLIVNGKESIGGFGLELPASFTLENRIEEGSNAA